MDTDQRAREIQKMFGSIARRYDLLNRLLSFGLDQSWRRYAARVTAGPNIRRILDVCAGTGDLALAYADTLDAEGYIVASDFCHEMLALAKEKFEGHKDVARLSLCQADARQLPFRDNGFDLAGVAFGIRNVTDLGRGLQEMARVVRPGGKVVVLEFSQPPNCLFRAVYYFYFRRILPLLGRFLSGSKIDAYSYLPKSVVNFFTPQALSEQMARNGLHKVEFRRLMFGIVTLHVGFKP